jgi:segregation and condensation protein B
MSEQDVTAQSTGVTDAVATQTDEYPLATQTDDYPLAGALEALLFVSDEPVSAATLAKMLDLSPSQVDSALAELSVRFEEEERGIQLREVAGGWRLYSHPAFHDLIERYVISWDTRSLSQAALEALAVVAYHQPATRAAISGIRGVNSDAVIASLVEKGLVREAGRDSGPGNAILYATTRTFLEKFGLKSLKDLPPLEDFAPDEESREYIRARLSSGQQTVKLDYEEEDDDALRLSAAERADDADGDGYGDEADGGYGADGSYAVGGSDEADGGYEADEADVSSAADNSYETDAGGLSPDGIATQPVLASDEIEIEEEDLELVD